jgi:hypothetical protein
MDQLFKLTEVDRANQARRTQLDPTPVARSEQTLVGRVIPHFRFTGQNKGVRAVASPRRI